MKLTEDGYHVSEFDIVYEIAYNWFNAETSLAEPLAANVRDTKGKIWKDIVKCERQCMIINAENKTVLAEPGIKIFAEWQ